MPAVQSATCLLIQIYDLFVGHKLTIIAVISLVDTLEPPQNNVNAATTGTCWQFAEVSGVSVFDFS